MDSKIPKEYKIKGALKNYAMEALIIGSRVYIKIDIGHWGGNYGGEEIPLGNYARLSEYLSNEALEEVKEFARKKSEDEDLLDKPKTETINSEITFETIAQIDLVFQFLDKYKQEDSLHLFKQIGQRISIDSPFTELNFDLVNWKIGTNVLTYNDKEVIPFLVGDLKHLIKFTELYETKNSLLLELEVNTSITLVQLDKYLGNIMAVKFNPDYALK